MARQLDLHEDVLEGLSSYLRTELTNHRAERSKLEDRWISEEKDFWAEPTEVQNDLPVIGFAQLVIPLTAIAVEAVHARDMGQVFGLKELVAVEVADSANNVRQGLDKLFNNELLEVMQFRKKMESPLLQMTKNGTGLALIGYKNDKSNAIVLRDGNEIKVPVYKEKGASIDGIDINDFLMPFYATDISDAPWVGHQFRVSEYGLKQLCAKGTLPSTAYDDLQGYYNGTGDQSNRKLNQVREQTDTEPVFPDEIVVTRILLDWDVDDTDPDNPEYSRIEVYFHEVSGKVLGVTYADEERDYEKGVYWPLEYRWYGYGIAKQNHEFQKEVTTQHRQRLDNATIANMAMFKVKRDATWIRDDEPIFPGKKWFVENMDDIEPMFIGDVKSSAYNNENQVIIYSQQRTGVNELTLGMPNVGTPGTASDSLARVQESTRKFDYTYNNKKDFINRVIYKAAQQVIKYGVSQRDVFEYIPNGAAVETFLRQGDALKNRLLFNIQLAGAKNNKVLDRNTYTQLAGMFTQYATQSMALVQQMNNPQMQTLYAEKALSGADIIMLEILRAFDVPNPDKLVFNFDVIKQQAAAAIPPSPISGDPTQSTQTSSISGSPITNILAPNAGITTDNITAPGGITGANLSFAG